MPNFQNRERWWEYITGTEASTIIVAPEDHEDDDVASSKEGSVIDENEGDQETTSKGQSDSRKVEESTAPPASDSIQSLSNTPELKPVTHEPTLRRIKRLPMVSSCFN